MSERTTDELLEALRTIKSELMCLTDEKGDFAPALARSDFADEQCLVVALFLARWALGETDEDG